MAYSKLEFIFTSDSFVIDNANEGELEDFDLKWKAKFKADKFQALYDLGFESAVKSDSSSFAFLHLLSETFLEILTGLPELEIARKSITITVEDSTKNRLLNAVPFALGSEYVDNEWIISQFDNLTKIFQREIENYSGSVAEYLSGKRKDLRMPERVFFHLVEAKGDSEYPFAFLATYATKDSQGKVRHMPLAHALNEFKDDRQKLLSLLGCLNRAAEVSALISEFVESGELFHPLRLTSQEAYQILKTIPALEENGILCRIPNWWKRRDSSKVQISVNFGESGQSLVGFNSLISMQPKLTVDGVELTDEDIKQLLTETAGLALIKGKWIEVDKKRLKELLGKMKEYGGDISFIDALRLENGLNDKDIESEDDDLTFTNGKWLSQIMQQLRRPDSITTPSVPDTVNAQLRHYQETGYAWLNLMATLGLGACLADDMGLGKTLQVLTFLDSLRHQKEDAHILLIVPASLLGNWEKEAERFAPEINLHILHGRTKSKLEEELRGELPFLTITTYAMAARLEELQKLKWDAVILDEAQAIKNPGTKQTRFIKKIPAQLRIALTGTPIENNLSNLWSLFDFLNKGLLGSAEEFSKYSNKLVKKPENYQKLRRMLSPFILRRLKTDKSIIADLPDKMEQIDYVNLSKKQIVLYRKQVAELKDKIIGAEGLSRRGIILATITKLKQICNHPDQFLGLDVYNPVDSGKFELLREICETIYEKRERVLIFTQYREITDFLADYLSDIFHHNGLVLHGGTRIKKRTEMVEAFNGADYIPFMVLSVKAAGVGLNLTAANHVIHFDRWWNPAVENQATDRAYRIGQSKNVIVHKFVTKGTIEERIDDIINKKKSLAENIIGAGEQWITELSDQEIISMMQLKL